MSGARHPRQQWRSCTSRGFHGQHKQKPNDESPGSVNFNAGWRGFFFFFAPWAEIIWRGAEWGAERLESGPRGGILTCSSNPACVHLGNSRHHDGRGTPWQWTNQIWPQGFPSMRVKLDPHWWIVVPSVAGAGLYTKRLSKKNRDLKARRASSDEAVFTLKAFFLSFENARWFRKKMSEIKANDRMQFLVFVLAMLFPCRYRSSHSLLISLKSIWMFENEGQYKALPTPIWQSFHFKSDQSSSCVLGLLWIYNQGTLRPVIKKSFSLETLISKKSWSFKSDTKTLWRYCSSDFLTLSFCFQPDEANKHCWARFYTEEA